MPLELPMEVFHADRMQIMDETAQVAQVPGHRFTVSPTGDVSIASHEFIDLIVVEASPNVMQGTRADAALNGDAVLPTATVNIVDAVNASPGQQNRIVESVSTLDVGASITSDITLAPGLRRMSQGTNPGELSDITEFVDRVGASRSGDCQPLTPDIMDTLDIARNCSEEQDFSCSVTVRSPAVAMCLEVEQASKAIAPYKVAKVLNIENGARTLLQDSTLSQGFATKLETVRSVPQLALSPQTMPATQQVLSESRPSFAAQVLQDGIARTAKEILSTPATTFVAVSGEKRPSFATQVLQDGLAKTPSQAQVLITSATTSPGVSGEKRPSFAAQVLQDGIAQTPSQVLSTPATTSLGVSGVLQKSVPTPMTSKAVPPSASRGILQATATSPSSATPRGQVKGSYTFPLSTSQQFVGMVSSPTPAELGLRAQSPPIYREGSSALLPRATSPGPRTASPVPVRPSVPVKTRSGVEFETSPQLRQASFTSPPPKSAPLRTTTQFLASSGVVPRALSPGTTPRRSDTMIQGARMSPRALSPTFQQTSQGSQKQVEQVRPSYVFACSPMTSPRVAGATATLPQAMPIKADIASSRSASSLPARHYSSRVGMESTSGNGRSARFRADPSRFRSLASQAKLKYEDVTSAVSTASELLNKLEAQTGAAK